MAEFRELAVRRVKDGESAAVVVKELGLSDQTLRNWFKASRKASSKELAARLLRRKQWRCPDCVPRSPD